MVILLTGIGLIFQFPATRFIDILYGVNMTNIDDALACSKSIGTPLNQKYNLYIHRTTDKEGRFLLKDKRQSSCKEDCRVSVIFYLNVR